MNTSRGARLDDRQAKRTLVSKEDSAETDQNEGRWPRHRERKTELHVIHTPKIGTRKVDIIGEKNTKTLLPLKKSLKLQRKDHRQPDLADLLEVRQQPPLVRLVVVRVHDERGVRPGPGRLLCQAHRLGGRVGPKLDLTPS